MDSLCDQILEEILKETDKMLWSLARNTNIPGYDPDDLMQEMRIKIWETVKNNLYDPELVKETSFYYRVCKNYLIDLNKSKIYKYNSTSPENRRYRDTLDQKCVIDDDEISNIGGFQPSFVQNFSKDFIREFVLLDEDKLSGEPNEESGDSQIEDCPRNQEYQK